MPKTTNVTVSIIVPCYNQSQYMRETLDCLKKQTLAEWECIIVNDGSTDNSLDIAKEYVESDNRYILVDKPNGGLADARNAGIKISHGEFILPLDADDLINPTYTEKAVAILRNNSNVKVVYSKANFFGARTGEWVLPEYSIEALLRNNCIFCSALFRRADYDLTNGYNPNMKYGWEDWDFWLSLLENGGDVYKIPETLFFYRKKTQSMIEDLKKNEKNRTDLYKTIVINHPILYIHHYSKLYDKLLDITNSRLFVMFRMLRFLKRGFSHNQKKL